MEGLEQTWSGRSSQIQFSIHMYTISTGQHQYITTFLDKCLVSTTFAESSENLLCRIHNLYFKPIVKEKVISKPVLKTLN